MPFKSQRQRRFMFATDPAMARRWAEHTPDIKSLPESAESPKEDSTVTSKFAGIASSDPVSMLTSGLSAPFATDTGNRVESYGRGVLLGGGTSAGAAAGGALGGALADGGTPRQQAAATLLGLLGGGALGYKGTQHVLGQPSWKNKEKDPVMKTPTKLVTAAAVGAALASMPPGVQALIEKKAEEHRRRESATTLNSFLDTMAASVPLEKSAGFRVIQANIASGKPIGEAIKVAFPNSTGEQRGALALTLVQQAVAWRKQAGFGDSGGNPGYKISKKREFRGPMSAASDEMKKMAHAA